MWPQYSRIGNKQASIGTNVNKWRTYKTWPMGCDDKTARWCKSENLHLIFSKIQFNLEQTLDGDKCLKLSPGKWFAICNNKIFLFFGKLKLVSDLPFATQQIFLSFLNQSWLIQTSQLHLWECMCLKVSKYFMPLYIWTQKNYISEQNIRKRLKRSILRLISFSLKSEI